VTRRRRVSAAGVAGLCAVLVLGCGKDHGTGSTKNAPLFEFNAQQNGGRTVRWANLPVRVHLGGGVARADEVAIWSAATNGAVTFAFVSTPAAANITFAYRSGTDICGVTFVEFDDDGAFTTVGVQVSQAIYRGPQCQRTVTHESAHAIGFLGHTSEGALMDPDGGNGEITPLVVGVLSDLYHFPAGTRVSAEAVQFGLRRPGGKRVLSFVTPVRQ
jgi:hypothetical protein